MNNFTSNTEKLQIDEERAHRLDVRKPERGSSLSKAHIPPQGKVKFYNGGSILRYEKPKYPIKGKHSFGYRSGITKFSKNSRRRLLYKIGGINKSELPVFITLTYPNEYTNDSKQWKNDLENLFKRMVRLWPVAAAIWKLEPQKRGAPHYHLLVWGVSYKELRQWVPQAWYEVVGSSDIKHLLWHYGVLGHGNTHCVSEVHSWRGVWSYASKYLGKTCDIEGWKTPGRFWGVKNAKCIPWAEIETISITDREAYKLLRLMRRFAGMKNRSYQSLTIFCEAEYWYMRRASIFT